MFKKLLLGITLTLGCPALHAGPIDWITAKYAQARLATYKFFYPQWCAQQEAIAPQIAQLGSFLAQNILDMESQGKIYAKRINSLNSLKKEHFDIRLQEEYCNGLLREYFLMSEHYTRTDMSLNYYDRGQKQQHLECRLDEQKKKLYSAREKLAELQLIEEQNKQIDSQQKEIFKEQILYIETKKGEFRNELDKPEYQNISGLDSIKQKIFNSQFIGANYLNWPLVLQRGVYNYNLPYALGKWATVDIKKAYEFLLQQQTLYPIAKTDFASFKNKLDARFKLLFPEAKEQDLILINRDKQREFKQWQVAQPSYREAKAWFDGVKARNAPLTGSPVDAARV